MDQLVSKRGIADLDASAPEDQVLGARTIQVSLLAEGALRAIDAAGLTAGDVVLFRRGSKRVSHKVIRSFQRRVAVRSGLSPEVADWVHVGVLDSNLNVWDATDAGDIRQTPLREVLAKGDTISFRRCASVPQAPTSEKLVDAALLRFSEARYDLMHFVGPLADLLFPGLGLLGEPIEAIRSAIPARGKRVVADLESEYRKVICSVFVSEVLGAAIGGSVQPTVLTPLPMDFTRPPYLPMTVLRCRPVLPSLPRPAAVLDL